MQVFNNKVLRTISYDSYLTNGPWFVRDFNIPKNLEISKIQDHIRQLTERFFKSIHIPTSSMHYHLNIGPPTLTPPSKTRTSSWPNYLIASILIFLLFLSSYYSHQNFTLLRSHFIAHFVKLILFIVFIIHRYRSYLILKLIVKNYLYNRCYTWLLTNFFIFTYIIIKN